MSGGGGKGGETTQSIDPRLAAASAEAMERATAASKLPYSPNRGVTIAAFTPQQEAAMRNTSAASQAFGLDGGSMAQMPNVETSASGIRGYSTGADYDQMIQKSLSPELIAAINSFFTLDGMAKPKSSGSSSNNANSQNLGTALSNTLGLNKAGKPPVDYFPTLSSGGK